MSEILWAVIIGGAIGVIGSAVTSIPSLIYNHYHWKKDFNLQHLKAERLRREQQCDRIKELMDKNPDDDLLSFDELSTTICQRLPRKTLELIDKAMVDIDPNQPEVKQKTFQAISEILGDFLRNIDKQIEELTQ